MDRMAEAPSNRWRTEFGFSADHPRISVAGASARVRHLNAEVAGRKLPRSTIAPAPPVALPTDHATSDRSPLSPLTRREREVLTLICEWLTDAEIAQTLIISPRTVSNHVSNILGKLGAINRRRAGAIAASHGLV